MPLEKLTNSSRNTYGECHRKYKLRYVDGYKPAVENENLRFGTLVHACLEFWLNHHKEHGHRIQYVYQYLEQRRLKGDDLFELAKARAMMDGYEMMWGMVPMSVVGAELEFTAPLVNPDTNGVSRTWELAGKIDGIVVFDDSLIQVIEHKTTSLDIATDSRYWTKLAIDGQVSGYYLGGRSLGYDIQGTVYDVLRKPAQRPKLIPLLDDAGKKIVLDRDGNRVMNKDGKTPRQTGDTELGYEIQTRPETADEYELRLVEEITGNLDKYFKRMPVPRLDVDMVEYLGDMWAVGQEILTAQNHNRWPKNPRSCDNYGTCEFFDVCAGRESLDNPHMFRKSRPHEELSTPIAEGF